MEMTLQSLTIQNFMGCKNLNVEFAGENMRIYGDNATGKTTIQHAFNWLLFDKNAYGKTDFGIKPLDESGEVIHRLETSVDALFMVDGMPKRFKKVFKEKWTRRRGSAEDTYSGNETDYYVNTVPKKKKEYTEEIAKIIDEGVFRIITNPLYFNENIGWKERREMLLDICGNVTDAEVIASDKSLTPLLEYLKKYTVDELKSIVSSEMKSINKELGVLPSRIAEAELAKPTPRNDVNVCDLEALEQQLKEKVQAKSDIMNGAEILRLKAILDNTKRELQEKQNSKYVPYNEPEYKERVETEGGISNASTAVTRIETTTIPNFASRLEANTQRKRVLSEEWDEVFKEAFLGSTCPTCKRELPEDEVEEKKRKFNAKKASMLDSIEAELKSIKADDNNIIYEKAKMQKKLEEEQKSLEALKSRVFALDEALAKKANEFESEKAKAIMKLTEKINDLRNDIIEQELNAEDLAKGVDDEIKEIESKIAPIKDFIAEQSMIERQNARIKELKESQKNLSGRYTVLEKQLFLTEQFTKRKVSMLNERINSRFKYARFKLFDEQVNGGIAETCEVTYKGVPYRDLNTAGRINIGLDIINTLSTSYGVQVPIFVDNMESITNPIETMAQRIELVVSEDDKELRFVKGE